MVLSLCAMGGLSLLRIDPPTSVGLVEIRELGALYSGFLINLVGSG